MKTAASIALSLALLVCVLPAGIAGEEESGKPYYVGGRVCGKCHVTPSESFAKSRHKNAYTIIENDERYLKLKKEGKGRHCLICHSTGYGEKGGYSEDGSTPEMAEVGCEGCHGPGSRHAELAASEKTLKRATILRAPKCGKCHLIHRHEE